MKKKNKKRIIEIEVQFIPFPDEETRREAYRKWVKAFLSSKLKQSSSDNPATESA